MKRIRLAVLYGGRSAEHQVSVVSARSVMEALDPDRFEVVPIAITRDGAWLLPDRSPLELTASLESHFAACVFDKDSPHRFGCGAKKMAAAIPVLNLFNIHHADVCVVHERRCL